MTTTAEKRAATLAQLNLTLSFFPRAESRLALVFGVDVSLLAVLTAVMPPYARWDARVFLAGVAGALLSVSIRHVWLGMFPKVDGGLLEDGKRSIVYFGSVGSRTESDFVKAFLKETDESYTRDLLGQVWINSKILSAKFDHLRQAFLWLLVSLAPWLSAVAVLAGMHPDSARLLP